ncbi:unnamed protein product, partial [Rotaria sp. Silwood2]
MADLIQTKRSQVPPLITTSQSSPLRNEDIRLCTIYRTDDTDSFGFELNFHRREHFHSLFCIPGPNDKQS